MQSRQTVGQEKHPQHQTSATGMINPQPTAVGYGPTNPNNFEHVQCDTKDTLQSYICICIYIYIYIYIANEKTESERK